MFNRFRAVSLVLLAMYVPLLPLLFVKTANRPVLALIPVFPGSWFAVFVHGNKQLQYGLAAIGSCCILVTLF